MRRLFLSGSPIAFVFEEAAAVAAAAAASSNGSTHGESRHRTGMRCAGRPRFCRAKLRPRARLPPAESPMMATTRRPLRSMRSKAASTCACTRATVAPGVRWDGKENPNPRLKSIFKASQSKTEAGTVSYLMLKSRGFIAVEIVPSRSLRQGRSFSHKSRSPESQMLKPPP